MDSDSAWIAFKDQLQAHYETLELYQRELGGDYADSSTSFMEVLQAALQASLQATKLECERVREDCESMLQDMTRMRLAMGETSKITGPEDPFSSSTTSQSRIKTPLLESQKVLRIEHTATRKAFHDRAVKVVDLYDRLRKYSTIVPQDIVGVSIPLIDDDHPPEDVSLSKLGQLDTAVMNCQQELLRRKKEVQTYGHDIVKLWSELATETADVDSQFDRAILLDAQDKPESLGLRDEDLIKLRRKKAALLAEKAKRRTTIDALTNSITALHRKLHLPEEDLLLFLQRVRGVGLSLITLCETELARLEDLKKDHIEDFVRDARATLEELWDQLYYSEDERLQFASAWTDTYTDASLEAHENEILKLQAKCEELSPLLTLIAKHVQLDQERKNLEIQVSDSSRFSKRGYNPMAESKLRARIENAMPKVEQSLREALAVYESNHSAPFRVWGELYPGSEVPIPKAISRSDTGSSVSNRGSDRSSTNERPAKSRPRTPAVTARPISAIRTPSRLVNSLSRSVTTPVRSQDTERSVLKSQSSRLVSQQNNSLPQITNSGRAPKERQDTSSSSLPMRSRPEVVGSGRKVAETPVARSVKTGPEIGSHVSRSQLIQGAPPKMVHPHLPEGPGLTNSSTSSQVSTENWDAYHSSSGPEDEIAHEERGRVGLMYPRTKASGILERQRSSPPARAGHTETALQGVAEEGSFIDEWGDEGF